MNRTKDWETHIIDVIKNKESCWLHTLNTDDIEHDLYYKGKYMFSHDFERDNKNSSLYEIELIL
jgi:hypothetical protein